MLVSWQWILASLIISYKQYDNIGKLSQTSGKTIPIFVGANNMPNNIVNNPNLIDLFHSLNPPYVIPGNTCVTFHMALTQVPVIYVSVWQCKNIIFANTRTCELQWYYYSRPKSSFRRDRFVEICFCCILKMQETLAFVYKKRWRPDISTSLLITRLC